MAGDVAPVSTINRLYRGKSLVYYLVTNWSLTPLRIALIYTAFGFVALFASDVLLVLYVTDPLLTQLQAVKGAGEVVLTAGLIFVLSRRSQAQLHEVRDRIARQREELQVLHRVIRHNLRNNLNKILGYADLIHTSNGFQEECQHIFRAVEQLESYTNQASRINRVTGEDRRVTFELSDLIPRIISKHELITPSVTVDWDVPETAPVDANHMFPDALEELITNAIIHNDSENPTITIRVDPNHAPSTTEIRIEDNGPGIPESETEPLLMRREDPLSHPSGMGLWFVDWTIEHSDGTFDIRTNETGGTTAAITVPKTVPSLQAMRRAGIRAVQP